MEAKHEKVNTIMGQIIKVAESAKRECVKPTPNDTKICQLAYENLSGLLKKIEACIFSDSSSRV